MSTSSGSIYEGRGVGLPGSPPYDPAEGARQQRAADDLQSIRRGAASRRADVLARQQAARPASARSFRQRLRDAADAFRA